MLEIDQIIIKKKKKKKKKFNVGEKEWIHEILGTDGQKIKINSDT